jgi:pyruvate/2-oxoglutarate dehydrogenase complex dihydrolipoamide acyltransferase (E2) component
VPPDTTEIRIPPDLWDQDLDGVLVTWLYESGDEIAAGAVLAQIMVEKVQIDLTAPAAGVLQIETGEESPVHKGQRVGFLSRRDK